MDYAMHSTCLKISVRFLLDEFHGRGDQGEPEWPPSPLRLFQALVNVSARQGEADTDASLAWLERQPPPVIVATPPAAIQPRYGFKNFVPDNVGDLVAKSWSGGKENDLSKFRTAKAIRPTRLQENTIAHYLWPLPDPAPASLSVLMRTAASISAFGWGIDMAVADAEILTQGEADALEGERWLPSDTGGSVSLRVPSEGTLAELHARHDAFLNRISLEKDAVFKPVPPLSKFAIADYRKSSEMAKPPFAVFALRKPDDSGFAAFATARKGLHLGGMLRHCAAQIAPQMGWDEKRVAAFVLGHGETRGETHTPVDGPRLVFMPLPSVEWQGDMKGRTLGPIRRVLVTVKGTVPAFEFSAIIRALEGSELVDESTHQPVAFLRRERTPFPAVQNYFSEASEWASVTPVILPGYDDPRRDRAKLRKEGLTVAEKEAIIRRLDARTDTLLRKALRQAGVPEPLAATAQLDWRGVGFLPGVDLATEYAVPTQHRRYRRLHVRIVFPSVPFPGPLCIGGGRFLGLGLFAAVPDKHAP